MITALVIAAVAAYIFVGAALGSALYRNRKNACKACVEVRRGVDKWASCYRAHEIPATIAGIAWPAAVPAVAGILASGWLGGREDRAQRREKRKQADHERKMAELAAQREMTMESVKFLVENGIQAEVPGLFDMGGGR